MKPSAARILIVDDDGANRALLDIVLRLEGFTTLPACSGEEALAIVALTPPDLIVLDVILPGMSGYEVAARIRGNAATKNIPIIMVTALDDRRTTTLTRIDGSADFLTKPIDRGELCMHVRNLLHLNPHGG